MQGDQSQKFQCDKCSLKPLPSLPHLFPLKRGGVWRGGLKDVSPQRDLGDLLDSAEPPADVKGLGAPLLSFSGSCCLSGCWPGAADSVEIHQCLNEYRMPLSRISDPGVRDKHLPIRVNKAPFGGTEVRGGMKGR